MMWKRLLESLEEKLIAAPSRPWYVHPNAMNNSHQILSSVMQVILEIPIPERMENETEELHSARISLQWNMLNLMVETVNNAEMWFDEMRAAGISDIKEPVKPKRVLPKYEYVPPEPETFIAVPGMYKRSIYGRNSGK